MAKPRKKSSRVDIGAQRQPSAGVLVRRTYRIMRERHTKALIDGGFDDLNQALWNVIESFSGDDLHPSDLAARTNISKQAMNYLLGRLEMLGYVTRRAEKRRSSTLVFLTCRGQRAGKTLREAASLV